MTICFFIAIARSKFWSGGQYRISIEWNPVIIWRTKNTQQPANQHVVYIESVYGIHKTIKTDDNSLRVLCAVAHMRSPQLYNYSTPFQMKTEKVFAFHNFGSKTMRVFNWTHTRCCCWFFFIVLVDHFIYMPQSISICLSFGKLQSEKKISKNKCYLTFKCCRWLCSNVRTFSFGWFVILIFEMTTEKGS